MTKITKRDGSRETFNINKIFNAVEKAFTSCNEVMPEDFEEALHKAFTKDNPREENGKLKELKVEDIQDRIQSLLYEWNFRNVYDAYLLYRYQHKMTREYVKSQKAFIEHYINASNNANATVDDNSNVASKNVGTLNSEIHKTDNIQTSRGMIMDMLKNLYPDFDHKQYVRDLQHHIIYKNDESSFAGPIAPYCVSVSMYPFINNGIKDIGGLSASPKNLDSFCGIFINMIFAISGQFAGAVATSEFLVYFDYFARKRWGDNYYKENNDLVVKQIKQYFQQVVYSINQPTAARGMQAAFWNVSYFDSAFFNGMFGNFYFPDGTQPIWNSVSWLQKLFMKWFNEERLRTVLTFPVESYALVYKDGEFVDQDSADFVAEMYSEGHSFFTYISDTVDSLSSCCFKGDEIIHIKDGDQYYSISLADFINRIDTTINPNGNEQIESKYFINSYNTRNEKELTPITGILKRNYTGKMYTFNTGDESITITADHILRVLNDKNELITITAEQLALNPDKYQLVIDGD